MAAVIAATTGCLIGCSKGQTGGGNNTVSGYTRTTDDTVTNNEEAPEGKKPCPDCGKEHRKDMRKEKARGERHEGAVNPMPPEGAMWLRRKKPAPIPPAEQPPAAPEEDATEDETTDTRKARGTEDGNGEEKAPAPAKNGRRPDGKRSNKLPIPSESRPTAACE